MEHIQQQQRCEASQEFQQSLIQLEDILQVNFSDSQNITEENNSNSPNESLSKNTEDIDMAALEDAVADIEQYLAQKEKNRKIEN